MGFFNKLFSAIDEAGRTPTPAVAYQDLENLQMQTAMDMVDAAVVQAQAPRPTTDHPSIRQAIDTGYNYATTVVNRGTAGKDYERLCLNVGEICILSERQNLDHVARQMGISSGQAAQLLVDGFYLAKLARVDRLYRGVGQKPAEYPIMLESRLIELSRPFREAYLTKVGQSQADTLDLQLAALTEAERVVLAEQLRLAEREIEYDTAMVAVFGISAQFKRHLCRQVYGN